MNLTKSIDFLRQTSQNYEKSIFTNNSLNTKLKKKLEISKSLLKLPT